jgi:hypothetical protein
MAIPEFFNSLTAWINHTEVPAQIRMVDAGGLFKNPYFLVPFIALIINYLYRQAFNNLVVIALIIGLWYFSGTEFVRGSIVNGEVQIGHILPIAGVGVAGIAILIYILFIKQD